jgi:hypothetical protein
LNGTLALDQGSSPRISQGILCHLSGACQGRRTLLNPILSSWTKKKESHEILTGGISLSFFPPSPFTLQLYIAGESYAGTYIPYFAKGILDHNANVPAGEIVYNLKGLAIGNGWIDPLHQVQLIAKLFSILAFR